MWFRRRRRRPQLDLAALDRLSEAIGRAVSLLEKRLAATQAASEPVELVIRRDPPPPLPEPEPDAEPDAEPEPEPAEIGSFVLFVPTATGYRLATPEGVTPKRGELLRVEEEWYCVMRLGPSPLPGDDRRCAFLEHRPAIVD